MKTPAALFLSIIWVFLFSFNAGLAQSVHIRVTDDKKDGLISANIQLARIPDSISFLGVTDQSGLAVIEKIADGTYGIHISYIGYENLEEKIIVRAGQRSFTFSLREKAFALDAVTVSAPKPLISQDGDKTIVDPELLAISSANALEVLEAIPGMFVDQEGGIYLSNATPAQILINGREQRMSSQDMNAVLRSLPPGSIHRIEILRTPSARYDAASSGGIVNIILKKGIKLGRYGSLNAGINQGTRGDQFAGFNLNDSGDKSTFYLNANYNRNGREETSRLYRALSDNYQLDQTTRSLSQNNQGFTGYGFSYDLKENKIILNYDGRMNGILNRSESRNTNLIKTAENHPLSEIDNQTENTGRSLSLQQDLGLSWKLDSLDSAWDTKFGYSYRNGRTEQDYRADFLFPLRNPVSGEGRNDQSRHFFLFQSDLTYKFSGQTKLETGLKSTYQDYISQANYFVLLNGEPVPDNKRTNAFNYRENFNAAYIQASRPFVANFVLKTGLRLEHTWMKGRQTVPADTSFFINRIDFFPYIFLSRPIIKVAGYKLDGYLIYRRTISRPDYQNLNPSIRYIDEFSYETGNPGLQPQFTQNLEANISFDDTPIFAIGRNFTNGIFSNVLYPDASRPEIAVRTLDNLGRSRETYFRVTGALPPGKKYFFVAGVQYNLNEYDGYYYDQPLTFHRGSWRLFTFHSLNPARNTRITVSGFLLLKGQMNFYELENLGQLNVGLNQFFLKKKLQISLFARDVLRTMNTSFQFNQGDFVFHGERYNDNQRFGFRIRYDVGIKKKEEKRNIMQLEPEE